MKAKNFMTEYLWPSEPNLDATFTIPLPKIEGLKNAGNFLIQSEQEDTFMTSIMTKYESETYGIRLIEIYKNTQNKVTGIFYRLVGQMGLVKNGYPFLRFGSGIKNVSMSNGETEEVNTRITIHLPQANAEQKELVFQSIIKQSKESGISFDEIATNGMPDFYGSVLVLTKEGFDLEVIKKPRDYAWISYKSLIKETDARIPFDYGPLKELMVVKGGNLERLALKAMGLSVPEEANAAIFSVEVGT